MFCRVHGRLCCGPRRAHFILRPSMGGVRGDGPGPKSPGKGPFLWLSLCLAAAHTRIESTWDLWPLAAETAKEPTSRSLALVSDSPQSHVRPHNLDRQAADAHSLALRFFIALVTTRAKSPADRAFLGDDGR